MRSQVPQFIDIEDKVFGPFTFKQFVYIAGGAGTCFVLLRILPKFLAIIAIIPVALFSLALAFYKVNNKPFIQLVESFFRYLFGARLYIWKRTDNPKPSEQVQLAQSYLHDSKMPKVGSKLKDMTWQIDARKREGEGDRV